MMRAFPRRFRPSLAIAAVLALALALALLVPVPGRAVPVADACAFARTPITYEATEDRELYLRAMDLAGYDMLFPNDTFFSQRTIDVGTRQNRSNSDDVYVPPTLMKSIAWLESLIAQAASGVPFGSIGPALVSFDCGHGIGQVTSGMTEPLGESGLPSDEQALVASLREAGLGRLVIVIAHRLSTIRAADRILFLDGGRLVEEGSHADLAARPGGAYRRFLELQSAAH